REKRIFGVALEVAARERMPVDVDRRREQHVRALAARFSSDAFTDGAHELGVPRRAECRAARERRRRAARPPLAARAGRTVGDLERGDAEARDGGGVPEVDTGDHCRLLVDRELADELIEACVHGGILPYDESLDPASGLG